MKIFQTIRARLFFSYITIILFVIIVFASSFYLYTSQILEVRASESLQQLAVSTNEYLDAEFKNMNSVADRIISSEPIKNIFYDKPKSESKFLENKWQMFNLLFTVTGSSMDYQINLINTDGSFTEFGKRFDMASLNPETVLKAPWVKDCLAREGKFSITPPRISEWNRTDEKVISLCRAFSEVFGSKYNSFVEVQQNFQVFSRLMERAASLTDKGTGTLISVYTYDEKGRQVYPFINPGEKAPVNYYEHTLKSGLSYGTLPVKENGNNQIIAFSKSDYTDWTVVVCEQQEALLAPVRTFRNGILLMGVIALIVTSFTTFVIAKQLMEPIKDIQHSISRLNLGDLTPESAQIGGKSAYELEKLNQAYIQMVNRLQASLDETVTAKSHEIQARMLALQAQMNPHFLYNTITIISIKAEKNNETEIVEMCDNLATMLRYIAKETSSSVTIGVEIDYLQKYLYLMGTRYPNQFSVHIDIPNEMNSIPVPKLIIQPIIENCFKYAFNIRPPWLIDVKGELFGNRWTVTVTDNGVGFNDEVLEQINSKISSGFFQFAADDRDKIGLLNIYYRLKLHYKDSAIFSISNDSEDAGSSVTIGGIIEEAEKDEW